MMCDKNKINSLLLVKKIVFLYFAISRCYCVNFCVKNPCLCLWTNSIKQSESSETLLFYKSPSSKHMNVKLVVWKNWPVMQLETICNLSCPILIALLVNSTKGINKVTFNFLIIVIVILIDCFRMLLKKINGELTMFKPEGRPLDLEHGSILCTYHHIWVWFIRTSFCAMSFSVFI